MSLRFALEQGADRFVTVDQQAAMYHGLEPVLSKREKSRTAVPAIRKRAESLLRYRPMLTFTVGNGAIIVQL